MIISRLHIYGYGKWVNQEFDLNEDMQLFFGQNESGKSTLQSFIRSILFGFPDKRRRANQINRYEPRNSDIYGGKILIKDTEFGDIWVERTHKKMTLSNSDGDILTSESLATILGGLDENLFDSFYGFKLSNLQDLANVGADQLNDYFLSIGTLGSDKFLQIAKSLEKETDQLFKLKGKNPPLNVLLDEYEIIYQRYLVLKANMDQYEGLVTQRNKIDDLIVQTNKQIEIKEEEVKLKEQLISYYETYLKLISINDELEKLTYTEIPINGSEDLIEAENIIENLETDNISIQERMSQINFDITQLTRLHWARNHEEKRQQWEKATQEALNIQREIRYLEEKIYDQNEELNQIAIRNDMDTERIISLNEFEVQKHYLEELLNQANQLNAELESVENEKRYLISKRLSFQSNSAALRQQVAWLENQRVNDEENLIQNTKLSDYFLSFLLLISGTIALILEYIRVTFSLNYLWQIGILFIIVGVILMIIIFMNHRRIIKDFNSSPILEQIIDCKEEELFINEQSQDLNIDINILNEQVLQIDSQLEEIDVEQRNILFDIGFNEEADLNVILKTDPLQQYYQVVERKEALLDKKKDLEIKIDDWLVLIQPFLVRFPASGDNNDLIYHVIQTEKTLKEVVHRADVLENRLFESKQTLDSNQKRIDKQKQRIQNIFEETGVYNKVEFDQRINDNKIICELKEKQNLYTNYLQPYMGELISVENRHALDIEYGELQRQLSILKSKLEPNLRERANLTISIKHLEEDGTYQNITQELASKNTEIELLAKEYASKRIAMDLIYQTLRHGLDNPVEEMNEIANQIFSKLSNGRYTQIKMNKRSIKVRQFSDIYFQPHELSQGTLEQLYVALRLAFIISAQSMIRMPIIIDDAFVNFDEERRISMYEVLEELSSDIQILFFTFDQVALESFSKDKIIELIS